MFQFPFEGDRELELPIVEEKGDWIRVPFQGRIEVRVKENRFRLKDAVAEIVGRRWTVDTSQMVRREMKNRRRTTTDTNVSVGPASPRSNASGNLQRNLSSNLSPTLSSSSTTQIGMPGGVTELPAALSALVTSDTKSLPPYPRSESGTPTVISRSSSDGRF